MPSILARMVETAEDFNKRYVSSCNGYGYYYNNGDCYYSGWYGYGRWILLAVIIVVAFIVFFAISCLNARRRRRRGAQPMPGTAWMAPPPYGAQQNQGYAMNNQQSTPQYQPPGYAPPAHGGANAEYYSGQEAGVTQPAKAYEPPRTTGGETVYAPPQGPPPGKKY